jgi:hypothetical protein
VVEAEFGRRRCAVAAEGDTSTVDKLGQRQRVVVGEALHI